MQSEEERNYRNLAAQASANADLASNAYDKRTLLLIAQRYEILAERARIRANDKRDEVA